MGAYAGRLIILFLSRNHEAWLYFSDGVGARQFHPGIFVNLIRSKITITHFFLKHNDNNSNQKKNLTIQKVSASLSIRGKKCPLEVGMPDTANKITGHEVKLEV